MKLLVLLLCFLLFVISDKSSNKILPFSSIKCRDDQIFISLDLNRETWHKLISIDNIGCDAFVKYAIEHYGMNKCDYEIECYKYNIITNFNGVYNGLTNKFLPDRIGMEFEQDNHVQNGVDVECTVEKYKINEKYIDDNIKLSKKKQFTIFPALKLDSMIFKGIKNLTNSLFQNIFQKDYVDENDSLFLGKNNQNNSLAITQTEGNRKYSSSKSNLQKQGSYDNSETLKNEITEIKKEISKLENEEHSIEKNILKDIQLINSKITEEKSLMDSLAKREIIAGIIGGIFVFALFIVFYFCNGIFQIRRKKEKSFHQ